MLNIDRILQDSLSFVTKNTHLPEKATSCVAYNNVSKNMNEKNKYKVFFEWSFTERHSPRSIKIGENAQAIIPKLRSQAEALFKLNRDCIVPYQEIERLLEENRVYDASVPRIVKIGNKRRKIIFEALPKVDESLYLDQERIQQANEQYKSYMPTMSQEMINAIKFMPLKNSHNGRASING